MTSADSQVILSIVPASLTPRVTGPEKHAYGTLDALGKITKVVCITFTKSEIEGHTFELRSLIKNELLKFFVWKNYKLIVNQIRELKPQAILLEQPFMGFLVYLASRRTKVPYFVHAHNVEYMRFKSLGKFWWPVMYILERFTFRKSNGIFFVTTHDKNIALKTMRIAEQKCHVTPYGVPQDEPIILPQDKMAEVRARYGSSMDEKVFMFFGDLKYLPNIEALELILKEINPILKERCKKPYKLLICGGGLSDAYNNLKDFEKDNIYYAGFVNNIDEYTQSADVILNPVQWGGGIKTKIVEALGFNKNVVSTKTGALGVDPAICGSKLHLVDDNDWSAFVDQVIEAADNKTVIDPAFFSFFSWKSVAKTMYDKF